VRWPGIILGFTVGIVVRFVTAANDRMAMCYSGLATVLACLTVDYWLAVRNAAVLCETEASNIMFTIPVIQREMFHGYMLLYSGFAIVLAACITYPTE